MDGHTNSLTHPPRDRAHPPYPRTASRSSNSTASTRVTSHSGGNVNANYAAASASPRLTAASAGHSLHRPYSTSGAKFHPYGQHSPHFLPRELGAETRQSPMSSYLQEKLQRERKDMDGKSVASMRMAAGDPSSRPDSPGVQSSPIRRDRDHLFDVRRPISSGNAEPGGKKGLGIKEMEQTLSTLHKQNFDLKLELYHRREKQTALEERLEALLAEKTQAEDMNDKLVEELEKRDRAVEEAAAMIVMLEAQVETLLREREMVRHIEARTAYGPAAEREEEEELDGVAIPGRLTTPRPRGNGAGLRVPAPAEGFDESVLNRMPSFVSERSEATENLRNVYVGIRGSPLSVAGNGLLDVENDRNNHLASPSLSVLSTSSFLSVYGKNRERNPSDTPDAESRTPDRPRGIIRERQPSGATPSSRQSRSNSVSHTPSSQFQSLGNVLGHDSPLQRLERIHGERANSLRTSSSRQSTQERDQQQHQQHQQQQNKQQVDLPPQRPATVAPLKTTSQRRTKEEKREALRRVMTDGPAGSRLRDHNLPPTPDTISTTTLRRYKNSNDTLSLSQQPSLSNERSYLALSETTTAASPEAAQPQSQVQSPAQPLTHKALAKVADEATATQPPSITAFNSRREAGGGSYFDARLSVPQRPRSAGETTASRHRGNAWDSESDDSDSDAQSSASSLDIWMREGWKPRKPYATVGGRASPDLFGFPTKSGAGSWAPDAMFGALNKSPARDQGVGLLGAGGPPPPPNRRSSLHAQTGSASAVAVMDAISKNDGLSSGRTSRREGSTRRGKGHVRRSSDNDVAATLATLTAQQGEAKVGKGKDGHYPPSAGQQGRSRVLNRFFRRSLGSSGPAASPVSTAADTAPVEGAPGSSTEPNFSASVGSGSRNGIGFPSWIHRGGVGLEDERCGATPPPIMRNRAASGREREREEGEEDGGVDLGGYAGGGGAGVAVGVGAGVVGGDGGVALGAAQGKGSTGGGGNEGAPVKRKWLPGFARTNSLRNRN